jgi:hypothetical protein
VLGHTGRHPHIPKYLEKWGCILIYPSTLDLGVWDFGLDSGLGLLGVGLTFCGGEYPHMGDVPPHGGVYPQQRGSSLSKAQRSKQCIMLKAAVSNGTPNVSNGVPKLAPHGAPKLVPKGSQN